MRVPFLSRGSAAVAQAHVRLALRTPRGRSIVLSPFVVFVLFTIVIFRQGQMELGFASLTNGLNLATFGGAVCLLAILPFALNQFAIDGSGLTLALLSPLSTRELLAGKAVGNGLIAVGTGLVVVVVAFVLFPEGSPWLWLSLPPGLAATYAIAAPGAAALSAIFPRAVDLNSIGRGSNAHGLAGLLGLLLFADVRAAGHSHRARHGGRPPPAGTDAGRDAGVVWSRRPRQPGTVWCRGAAVRSTAGKSRDGGFVNPEP